MARLATAPLGPTCFLDSGSGVKCACLTFPYTGISPAGPNSPNQKDLCQEPREASRETLGRSLSTRLLWVRWWGQAERQLIMHSGGQRFSPERTQQWSSRALDHQGLPPLPSPHQGVLIQSIVLLLTDIRKAESSDWPFLGVGTALPLSWDGSPGQVLC